MARVQASIAASKHVPEFLLQRRIDVCHRNIDAQISETGHAMATDAAEPSAAFSGASQGS